MNLRLRLAAGATALALALILTAGAPAADTPAGDSPGIGISFDPPEVEAGPDMAWSIHLHIKNSMTLGLYVDSILCRMQDLDPGVTGNPRITDVRIPCSFGEPTSVSAGETFDLGYFPPAPFETGKLSVRLFAHRGDTIPLTASAEALVTPGAVALEHPSEFAIVGGKKVECVLFRSAAENSAPGLLLVHDHGSNARRMMGQVTGLVARGYTVMLVSLPGYGLSDGPADLGGPRSVAALGAALDRLKCTPGVDSTRLAAWGIARGAGPVASLAAGRSDLKAIVLQSGIYDLWATSRSTTPDFRETIVREAGRDSSAWRARSPLLRATSVKAATLVLHRESDNLVPADPARALAAAIQAAGGTVESKLFPGTDHALSRSDVNRAALTFLSAKLGR